VLNHLTLSPDEEDRNFFGLKIWIHGPIAQSSPIEEYDDSLPVTAQFETEGATVKASGLILGLSSFEFFAKECEALYANIKGIATFQWYEPNIKMTLEIIALGHIEGKLELTHDQMSEWHRFDFHSDHSYLPEIIRQCHAIMSKVKGNTNGRSSQRA
jgi:hypothetical protein